MVARLVVAVLTPGHQLPRVQGEGGGGATLGDTLMMVGGAAAQLSVIGGKEGGDDFASARSDN
jgi:hypothetical protein